VKHWKILAALFVCLLLSAFNIENIRTPDIDPPGPAVRVRLVLDPLELSADGPVKIEMIADNTVRLTTETGKLEIPLAPGEAIYGLTERIVDSLPKGEHYPRAVGGLDRRGEVVHMWVRATISAYSTLYMSSAGYGMFIEGANPGVYDIGKSDPDTIKIDWHVKNRPLSAVFISGSYAEILDRYTEMTGRPVLPPRWAFLPWKWRDECEPGVFDALDGVTINAEVAEDIKMYQELGYPAGVYLIDRPWAEGEMGYGNFTWDENRFPNGDRMVRLLHDRGWRVVVWGAPWALGDQPCEFGPEARRKGYIVGDRCIDYTNPDARAWHQNKISRFIERSNVDGWKLDRSEEYVPSTENDLYHDGRNGIEVHNDYPRMYIKTYYDATRAVRGDDFVLMPRAAYTGTQAWSIVWGGDTRGSVYSPLGIGRWSTDKGLRSVIISAQRMAMMGFPFWGSDTGGYVAFKDREVFARWLQVSCFCPLMEIGGKRSHEPWDMITKPSCDEEMIRIMGRYTKLHERLLDYTYELAKRAHATGDPVIHPLVFDWPDDPEVRDMWDQYMYGPALLVAPLWESGAREREVYLPEGEWTSLWDESESHTGPKTIRVKAPLDFIPVYVKAGAESLLPEGLTEGLP